MRTIRERARAVRWHSRPLVVVLAAAISIMALCVVFATPASAAGPVTGTSCSPSCDLYATTGTVTLPDATSAPIWGYSTTATPGSASLPGPVLIVTEGTAASIILHNVNLPSATSLMIAGQPGIPDTTGVTSGNSKSYSFPATGATALKPGTYLYEAGLTADGPRQAAMGLFGMLIVRPAGAPSRAYAGAGTAFADEAALVLSEIDPALNAAPTTFDMADYSPKYWLINGKGYPNTDPVTTAAGNTTLLRYINAGLAHHSMSLLGLHQTIIATDGNPSTNPSIVVAQTIPAGGTLDALVTVPPVAPAGTKYSLFEAAMHLDNKGILSTPANPSSSIAFGGMLTFMTAAGSSTSNGGPVTSAVALSPNPSNGSAPVTLSATIAPSSGATMTAAEYFVDTIGANGSGCAIAGSLTSVSVSIPLSGATPPCPSLTTLASGNHTFYVHGQDSSGTGTWGAVASAVLNLDKTGPAISNMALTPSPTNGTADVQLQATADDAASGNQNVIAAEYFIDSQPASTVRGAAITVAAPAATVSLNATVPAATVLALSEGTHTVSIRAQDALGNWGAFGTKALVVDKTAPATSAVSIVPNPTNGTFGVQYGTGGGYYERIDANTADPISGGVNTNIVAAEFFVDTIGASGTGVAMVSASGTFNSPNAAEIGTIDLYAMSQFAAGTHTIYVHGKDAAGNWGPMGTTLLVIDRTAPTVSNVTLTPPASNNTAVAVSALATDATTGNSNITGGEFFLDTVGASGSGTAMTSSAASPSATINGTIPAATIAALSTGNHQVYVHAQDAAGNWSTTASATLLIDRTAPTFTGITLTPNSIPAGTASVNLTVNGASDGAGGSGVAGGEWWFGTANPANGGGTAFNGLTTSIATSCLAPGTYTVRARIRDVAGNWSTGTNGVRTATLTVTGPAASGIFCDSFEAPNILPGNWSSRSTATATRLSVTNAAAMVGSWGMQAQGNNTNFVQYNFGTANNPATGTYDARFYFRPNGNTSSGKDIFSAATSNTFGTTVFRVRYRLNAGQTQVQIQVGTANTNTTWANVNSTTNNYIEVVWQSGSTLQLYVNGVLSQTLTAGANSVGAVRLGSVTNTGNATAMYFDAFASKRSVSPLIGP